MSIIKDIVKNHTSLLRKAENDTLTIDDINNYINDVKKAGSNLSDTLDRSYARTLLRYWAGQVYDKTGCFPKCELQPAIKK